MFLISIYTSHEVFFVIVEITDVRTWCSWCSIADFSSACTGSSPVVRLLSSPYYNMALQIIIGLLVAWMWGSLIFFSGNIAEMFGSIDRFEKNLGWTRNGFVIFWFGFMIIGFLILFGIIPVSSPADNLPTMIN